MALFNRYTGGEVPTATKMNETSIPVVSTTADISAPYTGQIVFTTADLKLWRYTGTAWVVFVGGPTWALTRSTNQSIANASVVDITWDQEINDSDGMHSGSSANVVINKAGYYHVVAANTFAANGTGVRSIYVYVNGVLVPGSSVITNAVTGGWGTTIITPTLALQLANGDQVKVATRQDSGGALNALAGYVLFNGSWLHD